MAVHTGYAHDITYHPVTQQLTYTGSVTLITKKIVDCIHGGQIVLSQQAFRKIAPMLDRLGAPQVLDLGLHRLFRAHKNKKGVELTALSVQDNHANNTTGTVVPHHTSLHSHGHHTWLELYQIVPRSLSYHYFQR